MYKKGLTIWLKHQEIINIRDQPSGIQSGRDKTIRDQSSGIQPSVITIRDKT